MDHRLTVEDNKLCIDYCDKFIEEENKVFPTMPTPKVNSLLCVDRDPCSIHWPFGQCEFITADEDMYHLAMALFDEGNMGRVEAGKVYLPDGRLFGEIVPCGFNIASEFHSEMERIIKDRKIFELSLVERY